MKKLNNEQLGFLFGVTGTLIINFAGRHALVLALVGVMYLFSNLCWIAHAKNKGEKYLGLQNKVFLGTSLLLICNSLLDYFKLLSQ